MMKHSFIKIFLLAALASCTARYGVSHVQPQKNTYITSALPGDKGYDAVIAPYKERLQGQMNAKISHTSVDLDKSGDNSNLGNLLADFTYDGASDWAAKNNVPKPDAAVINIGGLRSTMGAGDILTKEVYEVMPFENEIVIVKMGGEAVNELFQYYAKTQKNNPVSRLYIETDGGILKTGRIGGAAPDPQKTYYIATSDYLALGGDNMAFFGKGEIISTGLKMRELFLEKFKQNPEIKAEKDIRLNFKNKKVQTNE